MSVADDAFASHEQQWLAANPENAIVGIFLKPDRRRRASAFGCFVQELSQAAFHLREIPVAMVKLNWWARELAEGAAGRARHPVTRVLFEEPSTRALDNALWLDAIDGALAQLDRPAAPDMAELFAQLAPFYVAVARIEQAVFCNGDANIEANASLWTITHLLRELPGLQRGQECLCLPLALLARHGLTRGKLVEATPARAALLRDYLAALLGESDRALAVAGARPLGLRVRVRLDRALAGAAIKAGDPLVYLTRHARAEYGQSLWFAWREARALNRAN